MGTSGRKKGGHQRQVRCGSTVVVIKLMKIEVSYGEDIDVTSARQLLKSIKGQEISKVQYGGRRKNT